MKNYGFLRVAAATPKVKVADVAWNLSEILALTDRAEADGVSLLAFPELSVTGYTCADLFGQNLLIEAAEKAVADLAAHLAGKALTVVVGAPVRQAGRLYNCAVVLQGGRVCGIVPKVFLPTYNEFYESRWFSGGADFLGDAAIRIRYAEQEDVPMTPNQLFHLDEATFAVEICEDLWTPVPPSSFACNWTCSLSISRVSGISYSSKYAQLSSMRRSIACIVASLPMIQARAR